MSCIYKKIDREGCYCIKEPCPRSNRICNGEYGCPERTDEYASFNSTICKNEIFINGKINTNGLNMNDIKLTFPANNDAELIVTIGDKVSMHVYEGKTASFTYEDIEKIFKTITHIIKND